MVVVVLLLLLLLSSTSKESRAMGGIGGVGKLKLELRWLRAWMGCWCSTGLRGVMMVSRRGRRDLVIGYILRAEDEEEEGRS